MVMEFIVVGFVFALVVAFIIWIATHDSRIDTNEVEICVYETWYSFRDSLWYHCKFRKKGAFFWEDFVQFDSFNGISSISYHSPNEFYMFSRIKTYDECVKHNQFEYKKQLDFEDERDNNRKKIIN